MTKGRRVSLKIKLGNVIEMSKRVFIVPAGGQKNINTDLNLFSKLKKVATDIKRVRRQNIFLLHTSKENLTLFALKAEIFSDLLV